MQGLSNWGSPSSSGAIRVWLARDGRAANAGCPAHGRPGLSRAGHHAPAAQRITLREDRNLQKTAVSAGRYDAERTVVPASRLMRMPATGLPASIAPVRARRACQPREQVSHTTRIRNTRHEADLRPWERGACSSTEESGYRRLQNTGVSQLLRQPAMQGQVLR